MVAIFALILILVIFGAGGFALNVLWYILVAAVVLWAIGFFIGGSSAGNGRRGWYGR